MRVLLTDTTWTMAIVARMLRDEGFLVSEAANGEELLGYVEEGENDVIVLDTDLPDMKAVDCLRAIRDMRPRLPVTCRADTWSDIDRDRMFRAGVDHLLDSTLRQGELAARLRAQARRAHGFAAGRIQAVPRLGIDTDRRVVTFAGKTLHLTRLEYEIVEMLALRQGALVTRARIMTQLYAWQDEPDAKILDVYICRIRAKLATLGAPDGLIATNFAQGYRLNADAATPDVRAA